MSFWCIASFFNPAGYKSLTKNYHLFKNGLKKVNLLTIELAFGEDSFCLPEAVHLRGNSVMWHKERLINYAVSLLPSDCTCYAWLDCDILFTDFDWANKTQAKLEKYDVIQLFKRVYYLPRGDENYCGRQSCMFDGIINQRECYSDWLNKRETNNLPFAAPGFAWAARRGAFPNGIYDRDIVGSGDCILADSLLGSWTLHGYDKHFNETTKKDIQEWAVKAKKLDVGYLSVDAYHLYHGSFINRKYANRHAVLLDNNYDPKTDIALVNGVYEWASDKPKMHAQMRDYFTGRKEDS